MFGFFSFLPFSSIDRIYINGEDEDIILHIQQADLQSSFITTIITLDLTLEKDQVIIL